MERTAGSHCDADIIESAMTCIGLVEFRGARITGFGDIPFKHLLTSRPVLYVQDIINSHCVQAVAGRQVLLCPDPAFPKSCFLCEILYI